MHVRLPLDDYGDAPYGRAPRAADAVGAALRGAFGSERRLSADLTALVRRLDTRRR